MVFTYNNCGDFSSQDISDSSRNNDSSSPSPNQTSARSDDNPGILKSKSYCLEKSELIASSSSGLI